MDFPIEQNCQCTCTIPQLYAIYGLLNQNLVLSLGCAQFWAFHLHFNVNSEGGLLHM